MVAVWSLAIQLGKERTHADTPRADRPRRAALARPGPAIGYAYSTAPPSPLERGGRGALVREL